MNTPATPLLAPCAASTPAGTAATLSPFSLASAAAPLAPAGPFAPTAPSLPAPTAPARPPLRTDEAHLRETLKRCSPATFAAVRAFRATGDYAHLPAIVTGVIERFVERELREKLLSADPAPAELRLIEDLGLDSLTLMEIVILTEDVLPVTINNDELRHLRTLGDVQRFITAKLRALPASPDISH